MYGPLHHQERVRLDLFAVRQHSSLESYVTEFSRLSLQVPEIDELTRGLLLVNGLHPSGKTRVLREHPTDLSQAIRSAQTADQQPNPTQHRSQPVRPQRLTPEERRHLSRQGGCFACRKPGHLARDCPSNQHPNAGRQ